MSEQSPEQVQALLQQFQTEHDALSSAISSIEQHIGEIESEFDNIEFEGDDASEIDDITNAFDQSAAYLQSIIKEATETLEKIKKLL